MFQNGKQIIKKEKRKKELLSCYLSIQSESPFSFSFPALIPEGLFLYKTKPFTYLSQ